jgi:hypothetical protein
MNRKGNIIAKVFLSAVFTLSVFLFAPQVKAADIENTFCGITVLPLGMSDCFAKNSNIEKNGEPTQQEALLRINIVMTTGAAASVPAVADASNPKNVKGVVENPGDHMTVSDEDFLGAWDSLWGTDLESGGGLYDAGVHVYVGKKLRDGSGNEIATPNLQAINARLAQGFIETFVVPADGVSGLMPGMQGEDGDIRVDGWLGLENRNAAGEMLLLHNNITFLVRVSNLEPGTRYYARLDLKSNSLFNVEAVSRIISFDTPSTGADMYTQQQYQDAQAANVSAATDPATGLPQCGFFDPQSSILGCAAQIIYYIGFKPTTWLMVLSGEIMDWGIGYSIDSASYPVNGKSFVTDGWRIMRDVANICFIFVLVYVAITTILGQKKERLIGMVIIVALVINFSLFLTKVIVDLGNITARFFYNNISITSSQAGGQEIFGTTNHKSISYGFAATFNPASLFSDLKKGATIDTANGTVSAGLSQEEFAGYYATFALVGSIVNLVAAFVFYSLAWLFIARTAGIWLAMIAAPLAFLSLALPKGIGTDETKKYTDFSSWLSNLVNLAVMPAIALLLIFLILTFLESDFLGNLGSEETTTGKFMTVLLPLAVISYLLLATKKIATSYAGELGKITTKMGNVVAGVAIGAATGVLGLAGRGVLGAAGSAMRGSGRLKNMAVKGNMLQRGIAKSALGLGSKMGAASFDARSIKIMGKSLKDTGFNVGDAKGTGGYTKLKEDQRAEKEKYINELKVSADEKEQKAVFAAQAKLTNIMMDNEDSLKKREADLEDARKTLEDEKGNANSTDPVEKAKYDAAKRDVDAKKADLKDFKITSGIKAAQDDVRAAEKEVNIINRKRTAAYADLLDKEEEFSAGAGKMLKNIVKTAGVAAAAGTAAVFAGAPVAAVAGVAAGASAIYNFAKGGLEHDDTATKQAAYNVRKGIKPDAAAPKEK